jgi:hypothetical protein
MFYSITLFTVFLFFKQLYRQRLLNGPGHWYNGFHSKYLNQYATPFMCARRFVGTVDINGGCPLYVLIYYTNEMHNIKYT